MNRENPFSSYNIYNSRNDDFLTRWKKHRYKKKKKRTYAAHETFE